jgi:hypothetical protein
MALADMIGQPRGNRMAALSEIAYVTNLFFTFDLFLSVGISN